MPFLQFYTTLPLNKIPENFQMKTAELITQVMKNKPIEGIAIHLLTDQKIFAGIYILIKTYFTLISYIYFKSMDLFLGSDPMGNEHNAYCVLQSVGEVSADENRKTVEALSQYVHKELGIKADQFRIFIIDLDPNLYGRKGILAADF